MCFLTLSPGAGERERQKGWKMRNFFFLLMLDNNTLACFTGSIIVKAGGNSVPENTNIKEAKVWFQSSFGLISFTQSKSPFYNHSMSCTHVVVNTLKRKKLPNTPILTTSNSSATCSADHGSNPAPYLVSLNGYGAPATRRTLCQVPKRANHSPQPQGGLVRRKNKSRNSWVPSSIMTR